jgi:hypothetical protein
MTAARRWFVALCGARTSSLWLAGPGLIRLPIQFVLALGGICHFCGKTAENVKAIAGVVGSPTRICNECLALCVEVIAERADNIRPGERLRRSAPQRPPIREFPIDPSTDLLGNVLLRAAATEKASSQEMDAFIAEARAAMNDHPAPHPELPKPVFGRRG